MTLTANQPLAVGSMVRIDKAALRNVIEHLRQAGYRTIGPRIKEHAIVYDDLESIEQLPIGWVDLQEGGSYRLERGPNEGWFDYVVGPHSLKQFLFRPREVLLEGSRNDGEWRFNAPEPPSERLAVIGPRACDLRALAIQDKVFLDGTYVDPAYQARRRDLFLLAVNCRRAAATCFCHSMRTGPAVGAGFDLALTEFDDAFVMEVGTASGGAVAAVVKSRPCTPDEIDAARQIPQDLEARMRARGSDDTQLADDARGRRLDTHDIRDLLMSNLEHPRWSDVADRCLACANCTMVCPTCFCASVEDVTDLTGEAVRRERTWASCFTVEHSYMAGGAVRPTTRARYRQWLTHKLATWIDQFGESGCVGCGRCITWCPVGIDLTEEVAAIREGRS
jgi:sulfhydrogenase subunit beta (sulfur reductase)